MRNAVEKNAGRILIDEKVLRHHTEAQKEEALSIKEVGMIGERNLDY